MYIPIYVSTYTACTYLNYLVFYYQDFNYFCNKNWNIKFENQFGKLLIFVSSQTCALKWVSFFILKWVLGYS